MGFVDNYGPGALHAAQYGRPELFCLLLPSISDYLFIFRLLECFGALFGTVGTTAGLLCCIAFLLFPFVALFL